MWKVEGGEDWEGVRRGKAVSGTGRDGREVQEVRKSKKIHSGWEDEE